MAAVAYPGVVLAVLLGGALFLAGQHRQYGRIGGWPGLVTTAVLASGCGVAVYAVWPLPGSVDGLCAITGGAPMVADPLGTVTPFTAAAAAHAGAAAGVFVPVGLLARYRYRRGWVATVVLGAVAALAVEAVQATGVAGLYPCAYRTAAVDDVVLGAAGALLGWALGVAATRLLPRGWPAAVPDLMPPALSRRILGHAVDMGLCWFGATAIAAVAAASPAVPWVGPEQLRPVLLCALALSFGLVVPLLRADRCSPGRAFVHLALGAAHGPGPAGRVRTAVRSVVLYGPVLALVLLDLAWWSLAVAALHGCCVVVRRDQSGLADVLIGTRVTTRTAVSGGLPRRMVRYAPPRVPAAARSNGAE
ncbi:VanZ like protein [Murinocardiopsis flavida]|uniref:VanZ like protein n=1 Tax=Murinocardiopsis flavida TaxID=645275 RepID=A0A2P8DIX3_9ACTN|nr:VanZ like protein [Murinocardiopsis flavida]